MVSHPPPPRQLVQGTASGPAPKVPDPLGLPRLPCNLRKELDGAQGDSWAAQIGFSSTCGLSFPQGQQAAAPGQTQTWDAGSLRSGYQHGWVLRRTVFLACRRPPSRWVLTWWRERDKVPGASFCKDINSIMGTVPAHMTSSTPHYLQRPTSKNHHIDKLAEGWRGYKYSSTSRPRS